MNLSVFQRLVLIGIAQLMGPMMFSERTQQLCRLLLDVGCGHHTESQQHSMLFAWCDRWAKREDSDVDLHVTPR